MDKDERILEMLKEGKSYTDIMAELYVSPSRIVIVKKRNKDLLSSTDNALLGPFKSKKEVAELAKKETVEAAIVPPLEEISKVDVVVKTKPTFHPPDLSLSDKLKASAAAIDAKREKEQAIARLKEIARSKETKNDLFSNPTTTTPIVNAPTVNSPTVVNTPVIPTPAFTKEYSIMKEYLNLDKKTVRVESILNFLMRIQDSIKKLEIRKGSKYEKEMLHIYRLD